MRARLAGVARQARRALERPADPPTGVSLWSEANRRRVAHWVWTPPGASGPMPLVLVLHGIVDAGGFVVWERGRLKEAAARMVNSGELPPFALVFGTDTGHERGSGYCNWADGSARVETYVIDELLGWAGQELPLDGRRHVIGISMGGYGALTLALRRPATFHSVSTLGAYFDPTQLFAGGRMPDLSDRMWGDDAGRAAHDPRELVGDETRRSGLRIHVDTAHGDPFLSEHEAMTARMRKLGVAHTASTHDGGHDWPTWRNRLPHHLRFHLRG